MDLQLVIALNVMVIATIAGAGALFYRPSGYATWASASALVLATGAAALYLAPENAGWVTAGLFLLLIVMPGFARRFAAKAEQSGQFDHADRWHQLADLLNPSSDARFYRTMGNVVRTSQPAALDQALQALASSATPTQRAVLEGYRATQRSDWTALLAAVRQTSAPAFELKPSEMRALGELGRIDEMVDTYERAKSRLFGPNLATARLFLFAFAGRPANVDMLLQGSLSSLPAESKQFWRAAARKSANPADHQATAMLTELATSAGRAQTRDAAQRWLDRPALPPLTPAASRSVDAAESYMARQSTTRTRPWTELPATLALIAINIAAFAIAEWHGGTEDLDVLMKLGALWPPAITDGNQWWRLITANVLHLDAIHLTINLLMLAMFGRLIESRRGPWHLLALYLWCAIASMTLVYGLMRLEWIDESLLIGASGAIFGLLGAQTAVDAAQWWRSRDNLDRNQLISIGFILLLQAAVDTAIPNVSFAAHACGFLAGLAAGSIIASTSASAHAAARIQ